MTHVAVLNVGDGACAVYERTSMYSPESLSGDRSMMIVDCGEWFDPAGVRSSGILASFIAGREASLRQVVVSHFDRDHWMGLRRFAIDAASTGVLRGTRIDLIYPKLPPALKPLHAALLAFASIESGESVAALDLAGAFRAAGADVTLRPLRRGHSFDGGGKRWDVLWPPKTILPDWSRAASRTLAEARRLAEEFPEFGRALDEAYSTEWAAEYQDDLPEDDLPFEQPDWGRNEERRETFEEEWDQEMSALHDQDVELARQDEVGLIAGQTPEVQERYGQVRSRMQRLGNQLSLAMASGDSSWLTMGDVQGWGLAQLLRFEGLRYFKHVTAPHHGTAGPGIRTVHLFPSADWLIAQNGPHHELALHVVYRQWARVLPGIRRLHSTNTHKDFLAYI